MARRVGFNEDDDEGDRWSMMGDRPGLDDLDDLGPIGGAYASTADDMDDIRNIPGLDRRRGGDFGVPLSSMTGGDDLGGVGGDSLNWGVSHLVGGGSGGGGFGYYDDDDDWGYYEQEDEGEYGEWKYAMVVVRQGEHKRKTGIVTAIHGHCPRHKHPLERIRDEDDDEDAFGEKKNPEEEEKKKKKKKKGPVKECDICKAAKKKEQKSGGGGGGGGGGGEEEKQKKVAFGCEECNWYVCADCHGKKGEKQWQCMLQVDLREGMSQREWFNADHLRLFAEAEDEDFDDEEEEKEDANLAKRFFTTHVEGQRVQASLAGGRYSTYKFLYKATVTRVQEDGNYDIKFDDNYLGEKRGVDAADVHSLLIFDKSGRGTDPTRNIYDFRFSTLPRGVASVGAGVEFETNQAGVSVLRIKQGTFLQLPLEGLAPGAPGAAEEHLKYTLTLDLKLPLDAPRHPFALLQTGWPDVAGAPQLAAVSSGSVAPAAQAAPNGASSQEASAPATGAGEAAAANAWHWHLQVGDNVLKKSSLRPGRWHEVTMVVNCKEGKATVFVDGKLIKTDANESSVPLANQSSDASLFALKRGGFLLFASSKAAGMPGGALLRRCSFVSENLNSVQLEQLRWQNRQASERIHEYLLELLPQRELSLTPSLRRKAMPMWLSPFYVAELGSADLGIDNSTCLQAFHVFVQTAQQALAGKCELPEAGHCTSVLQSFDDARKDLVSDVLGLIKAAEPLYRKLEQVLDSPEPQVVVFYLKSVKQARNRVVNVGDACVIPFACGSDMCPLLLEKCGSGSGPATYRLTVCNAGGSVQHHRQSASFPPRIKRQTCMVFEGVPAERAEDEAFWTAMVSACLTASEKDPSDLFYDIFLPYLVDAPAVSDVLFPNSMHPVTNGVVAPQTDWHSVPNVFQNWRSITLLWRHLLRTRAGLSTIEVKLLKWQLRWTMVQMCHRDLDGAKSLNSTDLRLLRMGGRQLCYAAVKNHSRTKGGAPEAASEAEVASASLWDCKRLVSALEVLCEQKPRRYEGSDHSSAITSFLDLEDGADKACQTCVFPFFDRLLRREVFPGRPKGVALQLPIDLLALPERVSTLSEAFRAMRIAEEISLKLAFISRERCEFAPYLEVTLLQHFFTVLLPLPRGPESSRQEECKVWGSWDAQHPTLTRSMQLDMLLLLRRLVELFITSALEMRCTSHTARTFDAVKITVLAAAAAVADRVARMQPMDDQLASPEQRPSEALSILQTGKYAVDPASYLVQSETMEVCFPELNLTRTAVVSYFKEVIAALKVNLVRRRNVIFDFDTHKWGMWVNGERGTLAMADAIATTRLLMDETGGVQLVAGTNGTARMMPRIWPEFEAYRDIMFWWKYFLCTDLRVFPEPRRYLPQEAITMWQIGQDDRGRQFFKVSALGKDNVVYVNDQPPAPPASGHRWPSPALPTMHTKGEVRSEDDLLYQRALPTFNDVKTGRPTLRPSDSEAMLSYLTVPYIRQPLLLGFFTTQDRANFLRQPTLQQILQSALLEPSRLLFLQDSHRTPDHVPATSEEEHLIASPFGQLLTELAHAPSIILSGAEKLLALTLSLATSVTSETVPAILFAVRLAARIESSACLLLAHAEGRAARAWPRLTATPAVLDELRQGRALIRTIIESEVLPWFDRWFEELTESVLQEPNREDECNGLACRLHAHQILVLRNVAADELNEDRVRRILSSFTFLSSHHTWNLERLEVPETELFEALQHHRRNLVKWLGEQRKKNSMATFNNVLRSCHSQLSAIGDPNPPDVGSYDWVCVGDESEYEGRYGVVSEHETNADATSTDLRTVNASDKFWIELNVQLLQITVRGRTLVPLEGEIWNDTDFKTVFTAELGEKGAAQKTTVQCSALLTSTNATVRELLSIPFRATLWSAQPATQLPYMEDYDRLYDLEDLEEEEAWIAELFEPIRRMFFVPPPPQKPPLWFLRDEPAAPDATVVTMVGMHPQAKAHIWKEVLLFKTRKMVHIYRMICYGSQLYRALEYTTNAQLCLRELLPPLDARDDPWPEWGRHAAGSSSCELNSHPPSVVVSRTGVRGSNGFGAEVDGTADPMDDSDRWSEADEEEEVDAEVIVDEDGTERRRRPLKALSAEPLPVYCQSGHEVTAEKKRSNSCNYCSTSGTAYRCRDCDYDLCQNCHRNLSRRVNARVLVGDRVVIRGKGHDRKDGVDWRFCFFAGQDMAFTFAPCTQRKCVLRNSNISGRRGMEARDGGIPLGGESDEFEVMFEKTDEGYEISVNGQRQVDLDFQDRHSEAIDALGFDVKAGSVKGLELYLEKFAAEKTPFERMMEVGEQYLPPRTLEGLLPEALTEAYHFYQENSPPHRVLRGYPRQAQQQHTDDDTAEEGTAKLDHIVIVKLVRIRRVQCTGLRGWGAVVTRRYRDGLGRPDQFLLDLLHAREGTPLHNLADMLCRAENLSYILAWTKTDPWGESQHMAIDRVEMPRLQLSWEVQRGPSGELRLCSVDHSGLFIPTTPPSTARSQALRLLEGVPHALLLQSEEEELFACVPNVCPHRIIIYSNPFSTELVLQRGHTIWSEGATKHYLYPVHVSASFLQPPTTGAALYLLLLMFMHRDYTLVAQLVTAVATDSPYCSEDMTCFKHLCTLVGDEHPDAEALRCRIALAVQHARMPLPWRLYETCACFVKYILHVSGQCRLTFEEEMYVLTMCRHFREKLLIVTQEVDTQRRENSQMLKKFQNMLTDANAKTSATGEDMKTYRKWKERIIRRLRAARLGTRDEELESLLLDAMRGVRLEASDVNVLQNREKYLTAMQEGQEEVMLELLERPVPTRWSLHSDINALLASPFDLMSRVLGEKAAAERDKGFETGPEVPPMRKMPYVMAVEHISKLVSSESMSFLGEESVELFVTLYSLFTQSLGVKLPRVVNPTSQHTFATLSLALATGGQNHGILQSLLHICRRSPKVCEGLPKLDRPRRCIWVRQWKQKLIAIHKKLMHLAQQPEILKLTGQAETTEEGIEDIPKEESVVVIQPRGGDFGGLCPQLAFDPPLVVGSGKTAGRETPRSQEVLTLLERVAGGPGCSLEPRQVTMILQQLDVSWPEHATDAVFKAIQQETGGGVTCSAFVDWFLKKPNFGANAPGDASHAWYPSGPPIFETPEHTDLQCNNRNLAIVQDSGSDLATSADDLAALAGRPLQAVVSLGHLVLDVPARLPQAALPFDIAGHIAVKHKVARRLLERMQNEMAKFAEMQRTTPAPRFKELGSAEVAALAKGDANAAQAAEAALEAVLNQLRATKKADTAFVDTVFREVLAKGNHIDVGQPPDVSKAATTSQVERLKHWLLRYSGHESAAWLQRACRSMLSSSALEDWRRLNPFLPEAEVAMLVQLTAHGMLRAVRVVLTNGALADGRDLLQLLRKAIEAGRQGNLTADLQAGLVQKSEALSRRLDARRYYIKKGETGEMAYDPRFLAFEFADNKMLHERQVALVGDFYQTVLGGKSAVKQMIMGAGKTTVVSPLLSLMLANGQRLVSLVVPPALLEFCRGVLMAVFSSIIQKRICIFHCDRSEDVDIAIYDRIEAVRKEGHVLLTRPTDVKSLILRFVENLDICNDRRSKRNTAALQKETVELGKVLEVLSQGVCMIDEVDMVLHPLRSELNFPVGPKNLIDFAPHRWRIPLHLLEGFFISEQGGPDMKPPERFADSAKARDILQQIADTVSDGTRELKMQRSPHLVLLSLEFYEDRLKEVMASWMTLWLSSEHVGRSFSHEKPGGLDGGLDDSEVRTYLLKGAEPGSLLADRIHELPKRDIQMLNLASDWLCIFLPHVLQKINRVTYGIMTDLQVEQALVKQPGMPLTRAKLAIPFIGKDVPSPSSEFAHPDVTIGLTLLSLRYEGLRSSDFEAVLDLLVSNLESEPGAAAERPAALLFKRWVEGQGGVLATRRQAAQELPPEDLAAQKAAEVREKKTRVMPLHMLERSNRRQMAELYKLLRKSGEVVAWYLEGIIFPEHLRFQDVKLMSSGQDLGGALLFKERIGFSGTPSDLMPKELGTCDFEPGSEGSIVHTLTNPDVVSFEVFKADWTVATLLDRVALGGFHALIDTGALITGLSNKEVAMYLLGLDSVDSVHPTLPASYQGVVFIDDEGQKKILLRQTREVLNLADSGVPTMNRFAFYDQVHTTGMDIAHKRDCIGAITLGKDMVFRDYAQGAYRLRGINKGQRLRILIIPEVKELISRNMLLARSNPDSPVCTDDSMLGDVCGWLVINSMLSDRMQFNVLQTQNLSNIWRKNAWRTIMKNYPLLTMEEIVNCIEVFKEPIDFRVLDCVPDPKTLLQTVESQSEEFERYILSDEDRETVEWVRQNVIEVQDACEIQGQALQAEAHREAEAEREVEEEKEEEREQQIEIEKFVDLMYCRDSEEPSNWLFSSLAEPEPAQFYKARTFKLFKGRALESMPQDLMMSENYYNPRWSGFRRLKNTCMVLEWLPAGCPAARLSEVLQLTETEESLMQTCCKRAFDLFTSEGKPVGSKGALPEQRVGTLLRLCFDQGDSALHDPKTAMKVLKVMGDLLSYEEMLAMLRHPHFRPQDSGRCFVMLSLAEAETLRRILHGKEGQGLPLTPSPTVLGLRSLASGFSVLDRSSGFEEGPTYQTARAMQLCRYFDTQVFFKDEEIMALLRGLQHETPFARRRFFEQVAGCRRRAAGDWAERPIAVALTLTSEFEVMVQRIRAVRLREAISGKGMGIQEAFDRFDTEQIGFLGPVEICRALRYLGFRTTPDEVIDWVEAMDDVGDHIVSYREFFAFVKQKVDMFVDGGERVVLSELGASQKQLELAPPQLVRAVSAQGPAIRDAASAARLPPAPPSLVRFSSEPMGGGPPPPLVRQRSANNAPASLLPPGAPPLARELSRIRTVPASERDEISMKLQDRIARRKRQEEEEKEHIAAEEEELQIAIEEQHGANPCYTQSNSRCQGATTADFDFQASFLPKDVFAFGFAEPVASESGNGFLQVDRQAFLQIGNLQLMPNGGSDRKLNVYGMTLNFCCGQLPSSDFGGGDVRLVRVMVHFAIADIFFVSAGMESKDSRAYSQEFKLEKGEHLTDIVTTEVSGVGIFGVYFKTSQGRTSDHYDGEEMEYMDSDDCMTRTYSARKGQMISGIKLIVNDSVCRIQGITQKQISQTGKAEAPSDRLTLVSLSRAKGDVDLYEGAGGRAAGAGPAATAQEQEAPVGCEIFVWKSGQIAPEGLQAPEERLPQVTESALQGRWELSFEGKPPPGSEGYVWQLTLCVEAAGRVQGEGSCLKRKKVALIRQVSDSAKAKAEKDGDKGSESGEPSKKSKKKKKAGSSSAGSDIADEEAEEEEEDEDGSESPKPKKSKKPKKVMSSSGSEGGEEDDEGEEDEEEQKVLKEMEDEEGGDEDEDEGSGSEREEPKVLTKEGVDEALHPMIDKMLALKDSLDNWDGDLARVVKGKKDLHEEFKSLHKSRKLRRLMEECFEELDFERHMTWFEQKEEELEISDTICEIMESESDFDSESSYEDSDDDDESDSDRPQQRKQQKGPKLATLRSEGWLVAKAVSLSVFVTPPEAKPVKKEGEDDDSDREAEKKKEEEEDPTQQFLLDGAITDESENSASLRGEWRGASPGPDGEVLKGQWTAVRVVDESPRVVGLWRVSMGMQDGAPAFAWTMWLTVRFAVESRSGAVQGALLEGPGLSDASVPRPVVDGKLSGRGLRLQISGWHGKAELDGHLDKVASGVLRGVWWSTEKSEASGSWEATRLDPTTLAKLMEPRLIGKEPMVTTSLEGCRLHANGLKAKGKPLCPEDHPLVWTNEEADYYEGDEEWQCAKCDREQGGYRWQCARCAYDVCQKCEKAQQSSRLEGAQDEQQGLQLEEFALLDRFKVSRGKHYFEVTVEKVGEDAMIGWVLEDLYDEYAPGDEPTSWLWHCKGTSRYSGKDFEDVVSKWVENSVLGLAIDCEVGSVYIATTEVPLLQKVFDFEPGMLPEGKPLLAMLTPGDKGQVFVNVGQSPFQLQGPEEDGFRPLGELVALRKQWRVTLPTSVESWPVFVEPKRTADGAASLGPKDAFEELGVHEEGGTRWVRHSRGWSPVALDAAGRTCEGLAALPSVVDALEKRGDANGFKHFRFAVTKVRGGDTTRGVHVGQLLLRNDGVLVELADAQATCPDGQCNEGEGPEMAVDGRGNTKWHTSVMSPLVISLEKAAIIDSFTFQTAFDGEQFDPVEWRFEASNDLSTWQPLHTQETEYRTPRKRSTQAAWFSVSGKAKAKSKATGWNSGAKVKAGVWHALTMSVDLPNAKLCFWLDGEVALEVCDSSHPLLRCDGPLSLDPKEGLCLFGRKPLLKKEWGWMMGAQLRRLQLQTRPPDRYNVWSLQMPLGVWICRAKGICRQQGLFTRNAAGTTQCWRCKSSRVRSAFRPPGDADPRHPGLTIFTADSFEELLENRQHILLTVSADWCGACQQLKPIWHALAELLQHQSEVTVGTMDIDENDVDRRYFPEKHIPVLKLLKKKKTDEESERRAVVAYEGERSLPALLQFVTEHTEVALEDVLKANYKVYKDAHDIPPFLERMKAAARAALRSGWGIVQTARQKKNVGGRSPESWRRLCCFMCRYSLDPEYYNELVAARAEKNEEERELWIKLLINKLEEEVQQSLELGQPKDPAAFLRREVFLPGARPEVVEAVRQGLAESEGEEAGGDGISRKWSRRWSAVAQRRASHRAEPMALPMLQRSWAKVHAAMDARAPGRIQLLRDLMRRGLDLDFVSLGAEQPSVLWLAAANDDVEVLRFCLACGADPHREASGLLPLETAASTGAVAAASLLLRSGAVVSRSLHFAAASGQLDVLRTLLDAAADPALRVRGLPAAAVASALGHAEVLEVLAAQPQSLAAQLSSNAFTVLDLAEAAGHGPLQLAAQASHERCCAALLRLGGQASAPAAVAQGAPEAVRGVLEPQRMALFTSLSRPDETAKAFSTALDGLDASQCEAAMAGAGPLRPAALAALLDDQTAMGLLTKAAPSAPSALMWAQWAGAQAAQGELLSAGVTLSNADLESLRRLGRVRRVAEEAGGVAGRLLTSGGWQNLKQAAANLPQEDGLSSRLAGLRERMAWEGAQGTAPAAGGEEAETATDPLEAPAGVLADLLGQERFALVRFLVQREIASGSSWSTLAPAQLLMLHAASRYTDVHARCSDYLPLLQSSLQALPVSRGPCYRAVTAERARPLLEGCKPGSVVQWAPGTTGTLDFGAALAAIGVGGTTKGVIFKVRRLLTGREALPQGSQVFFLGGPLRVAGLFALRGPLLSAERQSAAAASPTADRLERLGPWSAQLDMVRRPRALEFSEALKEPLVMVLLDEEEAS